MFERRDRGYDESAMKDVKFLIEEVKAGKGEMSIYEIGKGRVFKNFSFLAPKSNKKDEKKKAIILWI